MATFKYRESKDSPWKELPVVGDVKFITDAAGEINITENGTYDVGQYASAKVNVAASGANLIAQMASGNSIDITADMLEGVTAIAEYAFYNNRYIKSVILPESVVSIGQNSFASIHASSVVLSTKISYIPKWAFQYSRIESMTFCENVTEIGENSFQNCTLLSEINIPNSVTKIGRYAFAYCEALTEVVIPNSVVITSATDGIFNQAKGLRKVTYSNNSTHIPDTMFQLCALEYFIVPNSVKEIGNYAFNQCKNLEYIDLTAYGSDKYFPNLKSKHAFQDTGVNTTAGTFEIRVPTGRKAELAAKTNWSSFADNIVEV